MRVNLRSRVNLGRMRICKRRIFAFKQRFHLEGGPISTAWLSTPGTLVFKVGDFYGYYNGENKWVEL